VSAPLLVCGSEVSLSRSLTLTLSLSRSLTLSLSRSLSQGAYDTSNSVFGLIFQLGNSLLYWLVQVRRH
jgi:hypothetical protein